MSYLIAINAKDLEIKDKDKCQKSGEKYPKGKFWRRSYFGTAIARSDTALRQNLGS